MKRATLLIAAAATAGLLAGCEPARENIVDTVEPVQSSTHGVKEAPGTEAPGVPPETAVETAAQPSTRTQ